MLGKLLKYEIKHSARYTATIYLATLAFAAISVIALVANSTWLAVKSIIEILDNRNKSDDN